MKSGLKDYVCEWEAQLNIPLMDKAADDDLVECIVDSWRSLEVLPQIKFKGYEFDPNPSHVEINSYIYKREKRKRKKEKYDVKLKSDDLVGKLTVYLEATILEEDPKTKEKQLVVYPLKKVMLIPLQDENGYFHLKGKRFMLIYQMVEKSTYSSSSSVDRQQNREIYWTNLPKTGTNSMESTRYEVSTDMCSTTIERVA